MDLNRLQYFSVIAATSSLSEAAKILRISSPALSKAMTVLESEMGFALFQNVGRGIILTERGREMIPKVEKILGDVESLRSAGVSYAPSNCLRLGSFEVFSTYFLQTLPKDAMMDLELSELIPGELEQAILHHRVDVGLTYLPVPVPGLDYMKVGTVKMGIFGLPKFEKKTTLETLPFAVPILPVHGSPTKVQGLDGWPDHRLPRLQKFRVTLMESALQLCRQGLCVAYLPTFVVTLHNLQVLSVYHLVEIFFPDAPRNTQDVFLVKRKGMVEDKRLKQLAKMVRLACKEG